MKPYYQDDSVTLFHGDCREIVPMLGKFDLVCTDPPYGITQKCELTVTGMKRYGRVFFGDWDGAFPSEILPILADCCTGSFYIFCPYQVLGGLAHWAAENELQHRVLWWKKENPTRRNGDVYWCIPGEHIFFAKRSKATFKALHEVGFFEHPVIHRELHPTQKPTEIVGKFIAASTEEGQSILDPFAGSGTTGRAAKDLGRKCTMIEIEERYKV